MRIYLKEIKSGGSVFEDQVSADILDRREDDGLHFVDPVVVKAEAQRNGDQIVVNVQGATFFEATCCRCLAPARKALEFDAVLDYACNRSTEYIDLNENIREEALLKVPFKITCKDDCKGLCPKCGGDLNLDACHC